MQKQDSYTLNQIKTIAFNGFVYDIPAETIQLLEYLSSQVGVPNSSVKIDSKYKTQSHANTSSNQPSNKKKRGNKSMEVTDEDWETIRTFQPTKVVVKTGFDQIVDTIRLQLNKISDKTFTTIRENILEIMRTIPSEYNTIENQALLSSVIYEISANNKFYSRIFADLYAELVDEFPYLKQSFTSSLDSYDSKFATFVYYDPNTDYDKFCEMNKINERQRANAQFYVSLCLNGFVKPLVIVQKLHVLLELVMKLVNEPNKKNEVDEITENIAILYNKDFIKSAEDDDDYDEDELDINDKNITGTLLFLSTIDIKMYKSLSSKSKFKYMDIMNM
jgi:hypothetical protein